MDTCKSSGITHPIRTDFWIDPISIRAQAATISRPDGPGPVEVAVGPVEFAVGPANFHC